MDAYYNQHKSLDASGCGNNYGLTLPGPPDKHGNHMRQAPLCIRLAHIIQDHNWTFSFAFLNLLMKSGVVAGEIFQLHGEKLS